MHRIIVDPFPPGLFPPSRRQAISSPKRSFISVAVTIACSPLIFALVAVIGRPKDTHNFSATGCDEIRMAMVLSFAVSFLETASRAGKISVKGPGQNDCINVSYGAGHEETSFERYFKSGINKDIALALFLFFSA